jgi:UDP-N-acetylglucosamine acyltransferase
MTGTIDIGRLVRQIPSQYPFVLVDRVIDFDPACGLVAVKNVTGSEEFFEGHFPGTPVMPGVLIMESLAQAAGIWLLNNAPDPARVEVHVVGIDGAKFRRPVTPGDQLHLEVRLLRRRGALSRMAGEVRSLGPGGAAGEHRVAEARLLLQTVTLAPPWVDPTARVEPGAVLGPGVRVGPYSIVGPQVRLGAGTRLHSHVVVQGDTTLGSHNLLFPFCSIGQVPQDLKYKGEATSLVVGDRNTVREYVTLHVGTAGGGGVTRVGSDNLFMTGAHVAHDSQVGSHTIFGNTASLAGHVEVQDWATIAAFSGVQQFCRVGTHAFVGGFTKITKDVLPYSKTVGNPARIYGLNAVGLVRHGFTPGQTAVVREAYRVLLQSRLNTQEALARLEAQRPESPEVRVLVDFIRSSRAGVVLKRSSKARARPGDDA